MNMQFNLEEMPLKERDNSIIKNLQQMEARVILTENKKIKIHVKNNHWAPGSFPTDAEGEKILLLQKSTWKMRLKIFQK